MGGRVFHIGIDIDGTATDCVLIDQAAPGAAVTCQMARALPAKDRPADRIMAGLAELAETAGLGPAVVQTAHEDARRKDFTDRLPGQDQGFGDRLRDAILEQISKDKQNLAHGKGPAERAEPENMYTSEHIQRIANLVLDWIRAVFGRFAELPSAIAVAEPGDQGDIYDGFAYTEWTIFAAPMLR
jgi:hypothetical protein